MLFGTKCPKASKCIYPDPCGIKNTNLDLNIQNNYGNTAFHHACYYDHLAIVEFCIKDARLNLNIQNNDGWTAFHYACDNGNTSLISLFLNSNRKINLNLQSIKECDEYPIGTTAYDILKSKNINIDVIKEKISKNKQLIFYAADGNLLELKKLLKFKK